MSMDDLADAGAHADMCVRSIVAALAPRVLLTVGLPPLDPAPADGMIFVVAPPPGSGAPDLPLVDFFARRPGPSPDQKPRFFDLCVIAPGLAETDLEALLSELQPIAHRRSLLMLGAQAAGGDEAAWPPLLDRYEGLAGVVADGDGSALLVSGLDRAKLRPDGAGEPLPIAAGGDARAALLADCRIDRPSVSTAMRPVPDAPTMAGERIMPDYRDIVLGTGSSGEYQFSGPLIERFWGRPVELLSGGVSVAEDITFFKSDSADHGVLVDPDGRPLPASFHLIGGYGLDKPDLEPFRPPYQVVGAGGDLYPLGQARRVASGVRRPGDFFLFGFMHKRFGHFLTESLAGVWALDWALASGMRVLCWGPIRGWQRDALELLGVPPDRVAVAERGATYERLYVADLGYRLNGSVSRAAGRAWNRMAEAAIADGPSESGGDHPFVYLSRAGVENRALQNEVELEGLLAARGGLIVRPETLGFRDQVRVVRRARAVVGCFGSQLHLSMFARAGARKLVIGAEKFVMPEETLIGIATGVSTAYYIEPSSRRASARRTSWSIDLARFAPAFDGWLAERDA